MNDPQTPPNAPFPGRAKRIDAILRQAFAPALLQVTDDSSKHAGHAGAAPGGETHFSVLCVSDAFAGQNRVLRSRAVHELLAGELAGGLHALALNLRTTEEQERL
jgi:stress-induced morphogen